MWEWILNLFRKSKKKKIEEIANRVERFKKRYEQAKDVIKYNISKKYHYLILNSNTVEEAEHYENEFYKKLEEQGVDLKNYKESKGYAIDDTDFTHQNYTSHRDSTIDDSSIIYYSTQSSQTTDESSFTEGQGEFGGGGASESWEETSSDNS